MPAPDATYEQVFARVPGEGWLTPEEGRLLWDAAGATEGHILEVGVYKGRSTVLLAALGRPLYCVDPFAGFSAEDPDGGVTKRDWYQNVQSRGYRVLEFPNQMGLIELAERVGAVRTMRDRPVADVLLFVQRIEDWPARPVGFAYLDGEHTRAGTTAQVRKALHCKPRRIAVHDVGEVSDGRQVALAATDLLGPWHERVGSMAVWHLPEHR